MSIDERSQPHTQECLSPLALPTESGTWGRRKIGMREGWRPWRDVLAGNPDRPRTPQAPIEGSASAGLHPPRPLPR